MKGRPGTGWWTHLHPSGYMKAVEPENDTRPHEVWSQACPCRPTVKRDMAGIPLLVHSAFDGREGLEMAAEVLEDA